MSAVMLLDNKHTYQFFGLRPHLNMLDINKYRGLSDVASIPKTTASTIDNWLSEIDDGSYIHEDLKSILCT